MASSWNYSLVSSVYQIIVWCCQHKTDFSWIYHFYPNGKKSRDKNQGPKIRCLLTERRRLDPDDDQTTIL